MSARKRHTAQQRDAIGAARLRVQRREQQQLLPRQRPHPAVRIAAAQHDLEGGTSLPAPAHSHRPSTGPQLAPASRASRRRPGRRSEGCRGRPRGSCGCRFARARTERSAGIHSARPAAGASHREAAAQPHELADGRIQHGQRLPHGAVELRLAGRDGRKARAELGSASRRAAAPPPPRRSAFRNMFSSFIGETLNRSSAADAGSFRQSIGLESLWYCAAVGGFAAPLRMRHALRVHKKYNCTFQTSPCQKSLAIRSC